MIKKYNKYFIKKKKEYPLKLKNGDIIGNYELYSKLH